MRLTFLVPERQIRGPGSGVWGGAHGTPTLLSHGGCSQTDEGLDLDRARDAVTCS